MMISIHKCMEALGMLYYWVYRLHHKVVAIPNPFQRINCSFGNPEDSSTVVL